MSIYFIILNIVFWSHLTIDFHFEISVTFGFTSKINIWLLLLDYLAIPFEKE